MLNKTSPLTLRQLFNSILHLERVSIQPGAQKSPPYLGVGGQAVVPAHLNSSRHLVLAHN